MIMTISIPFRYSGNKEDWKNRAYTRSEIEESLSNPQGPGCIHHNPTNSSAVLGIKNELYEGYMDQDMLQDMIENKIIEKVDSRESGHPLFHGQVIIYGFSKKGLDNYLNRTSRN
jgi:hypothetical protein